MHLPRLVSAIAVVAAPHLARATLEAIPALEKSVAVGFRQRGHFTDHTVPPHIEAGRAQLISDLLYEGETQKKAMHASLAAIGTRNRLEVSQVMRTAEDHPAGTPRRRLIVSDETTLATAIPGNYVSTPVVIDFGANVATSASSGNWGADPYYIEIWGCSDVTINGGGYTLSTTSSDETRGFYIFDSTVTITALTLSGFQGGGDGAGIYAYSSTLLASVVSLTGVTLSQCTSTGGGGGIWSSDSSITMNTVVVDKCSAALSGGGIGFRGGTAAMTSVSITDSTAAGGGAFGGGGLYVDGATVSCTGCTIDGNTMTGPYSGGGIYAHRYLCTGSPCSTGSLTLVDTTVSWNTCASDGGGIGASEMPVTITGGTVVGNEATIQGGGINVDSSVVLTISGHCSLYVNEAQMGGALAMSGATTQVILDNVPLTYNAAVVASGGAILVVSGTLTATNCHIHENYCAGPTFDILEGSTCTEAGGASDCAAVCRSAYSQRTHLCFISCERCSSAVLSRLHIFVQFPERLLERRSMWVPPSLVPRTPPLKILVPLVARSHIYYDNCGSSSNAIPQALSRPRQA